MSQRNFSNRLLFLLFLIPLANLSADSTFQKPNIVLILIDDAALMDLGIYGGEAATPNIDKLANNGTIFTNYHTSPMCAPSRAMLLTGYDSHLTGVPNLPLFLPPEYAVKKGYEGILNKKVKTIATRLKDHGYHTYITGKTAAEIVISRADAEKPNMALTTWKGKIVRKQDIIIAKNYLTADEIDSLNRFVSNAG